MYGQFDLDIELQTAGLMDYLNDHGFFLPFEATLATTETYSVGRYLEVDPLPNGRYLVDFNLAYNPYCAFNDHWSCPLTPFENRLQVTIRAGEKIFDRHEVQA